MKNACPDEEMLADYIQNRLPKDDRADIEAHLSRCEICLENFMVARKLLKNSDLSELEPVPAEVTEAAVRLVTGRGSLSHGIAREKEKIKRLINSLHERLSNLFDPSPWGELALAPIRGSRKVVSKDIIHLKKIFKDIEADIEIEKTGEGKALIRVKLPENTKNKKEIRITLKRDDREISSNLANGGYVLFEDIPFGHYGLTLERNGVNLGIILFEFKEKDFKRKGK